MPFGIEVCDQLAVRGDGGRAGRPGNQLDGRPALKRHFPKRKLSVAQRGINYPLTIRRNSRVRVVQPAGQLFRIVAVRLHAPDVTLPASVRDEDDVTSIGRDRRAAIEASLRQLLSVAAVGIRNPDFRSTCNRRISYHVNDPPVGRPGDSAVLSPAEGPDIADR